MNETTLTRSRTRTRENTGTAVNAITGTSINLMAGVSGLIGLWAVACMVGAMISSGGPVALFTGWFKAVGGLG
jgi:hypothetical protein